MKKFVSQDGSKDHLLLTVDVYENQFVDEMSAQYIVTKPWD